MIVRACGMPSMARRTVRTGLPPESVAPLRLGYEPGATGLELLFKTLQDVREQDHRVSGDTGLTPRPCGVLHLLRKLDGLPGQPAQVFILRPGTSYFDVSLQPLLGLLRPWLRLTIARRQVGPDHLTTRTGVLPLWRYVDAVRKVSLVLWFTPSAICWRPPIARGSIRADRKAG